MMTTTLSITLRQPLSFMLLGQRESQQDCRYPDSDLLPADQRYFVLCDGVGGHAGGDVASRIVCRALAEQLNACNWQEAFTNAHFAHALDAAYDALDAHARRGLCEMATTMVFAAFHNQGMTLAHIGDSRIYHIRSQEGILYRSADHSMVNSMVHHGLLTPHEAVSDDRQHIITRYMAPTESDQTRSMATVLRTANVQSGDYVFLCTDGVLQCIDDDMLLDIIAGADNDNDLIEQIRQRCQHSTDNATAILIHIDSVLPTQQAQTVESTQATATLNHNEAGTVNIASHTRAKHAKSIWRDFFKRIFG